MQIAGFLQAPVSYVMGHRMLPNYRRARSPCRRIPVLQRQEVDLACTQNGRIALEAGRLVRLDDGKIVQES